MSGVKSDKVVAEKLAPIRLRRDAAGRVHATSSARALGRALLAITSAVMLILGLLYVSGPGNVGDKWTFPIALASSVWLLVYFASSWMIAGTPYLLTSTYVIVLALFHLGITLPDGLNLFGDVIWGRTHLAPWLQLAGWYTVLALGALGLGYVVGWRGNLTPAIVRATLPAVARETRRTATWAGIGLLLAAGLFLLFAIASYGNIFAYSRVEFFRGGADSRGWGVFMMALPSAAVLLCVGAQSLYARMVTGLFAVFVVGFFLLTGYRSAALFPALAGIVLWARTGNRVPIPVAVAVFVGTILAIPAAGAWRAFNAYNEIDEETVVSSFEQTEAKDTLEQGRTAGVLAEALRLTPSKDPYRYGMTYLRALPEAIPNVLPRMGESIRAEVRSSVLNDDAILKLAPGAWITYRIAPQKFARGEGLGFSSIGEAYINFGTAGVVVIFALTGFLLARLDSLNLLYHPYLLIFAGAMFWPFLRTVRNDFANFAKAFGFLLIILLVWALITRVIPLVRPGRRPAAR